MEDSRRGNYKLIMLQNFIIFMDGTVKQNLNLEFLNLLLYLIDCMFNNNKNNNNLYNLYSTIGTDIAKDKGA